MESTGGDPIRQVANKMRRQMEMVQSSSTRRVRMTSQQAAMRITKRTGGKAVAVRKAVKRALR